MPTSSGPCRTRPRKNLPKIVPSPSLLSRHQCGRGILIGLRPYFLIAAALCTTSLTQATEHDDYILHCAGCHKPDASGSEAVPALDEIGIIFARPGGREYLAGVPGVAQAPLSDQRLAELLNWLLPEHGETRAEPPFSADEVHRLRAKPLRDPVTARQGIMANGQ